MAWKALSAEEVRTTGTRPISRIVDRIVCFVILRRSYYASTGARTQGLVHKSLSATANPLRMGLPPLVGRLSRAAQALQRLLFGRLRAGPWRAHPISEHGAE